jgi:sulfotransferase
MEKLIFNSSMPRSGSELLQVILHQNPRIYGSPTSPLLEYMYGARANYELAEVRSQEPQLMQDAFLGMCSSMANGYYDKITDRPIVCDKNRGWAHYYEWVEQWNAEPKMICMVRDLRSIIASLERIHRANRHRPVGIDNPREMLNMTVEQRVNYWLNSQPVGLALQRTLDVFQRGIAEKVLFVRYEDLCYSPQEVMNGVYEFIGEEPFAHDFQNLKKEIVEDDSVFGVYGSHKVNSSISPAKPSGWLDVIPQGIADQIKQSAPWYFNSFNY